MYALAGLAAFCLQMAAGDAAAQGVSVERFAAGLARRLGYGAPFIPEKLRAERLRDFLAGQSEQNIAPESFLSGSSALQLGRGPGTGGEAGPAIESPSAAGQAEYRFYIIRPGATRVSAKAKGGPQIWQLDENAPTPVRPGPGWSDVEGPPQFLEAGEHRLKIALPPGGALSNLRVSMPCVAPILSVQLASPPNRLLFQDKTAAMVRALGREDLLPPGGQRPIHIQAHQFAAAGNSVVLRPGEGDGGGGTLEPSGEKGSVQFEITLPQAGIYTIQADISGSGTTTWDVNGCRAASLPGEGEGRAFRLQRVATLRLPKGAQNLSATLRRGTRLRQVILQNHSEDPNGYSAAAAQLGLSEGAPNAPVSEAALQANLSNPAVDERRREFEAMDRDPGALPGPTAVATFFPMPDAPPEDPQLPSETVEEPYDTPVSPFVPLSGVP